MAGDALFTQLNNLFTKETKVNSSSKPDSVYMLNRFLSLRAGTFLLAYDCNRIKGLPDWAAYCMLYHSIPMSKAPRSKYPKKLTEKITDKKKKVVVRIQQKFCVTEYHALQIIELLEAQGMTLESD